VAADRQARLVVVGAGLAGDALLRNLPISLGGGRTLMIDRGKSYTFAPLIHEVAVGRLRPQSVTATVEPPRGTQFLQDEVKNLDLASKRMETSDGEIGYDYLALAAGSRPVLPPTGLRDHFQTFWTLEDALQLRSGLNEVWQNSARGEAPEGAPTIAIAGGGTTGVELAAEVATLFTHLGKRDTRPASRSPRVILFEAGEKLMGWLHPYFHETALKQLRKMGVEVRLNSPIKDAGEGWVSADGERFPAGVRVWAAGVRASSLIEALPGEHDAAGRVAVDEHLTLSGHPEVYVLGDGGAHEDPYHGVLPPTGSVAVQQGGWAARDLWHRLRGDRRPPFRYFNRGYIVSLGPGNAIAEVVGGRFSGADAHALYRSVLLYYMKNRRQRLLTGADWAMERRLGRLGFGDHSR
jgi:NADH dehydrogenase